jgi:large subunit ribosomal protein L9
MRVILLTDIENIGREGDIKEVKDGYARNFLLPRNLAVSASPAALKQAEEKRRLALVRQAEKQKQLEGYASKISELEMKAILKVGKKEEIFGSISQADIQSFLAGQGIEVEKSQILLEEPIKKIGGHNVNIKLAPDKVFCLKVRAEGEEISATKPLPR